MLVLIYLRVHADYPSSTSLIPFIPSRQRNRDSSGQYRNGIIGADSMASFLIGYATGGQLLTEAKCTAEWQLGNRMRRIAAGTQPLVSDQCVYACLQYGLATMRPKFIRALLTIDGHRIKCGWSVARPDTAPRREARRQGSCPLLLNSNTSSEFGAVSISRHATASSRVTSCLIIGRLTPSEKVFASEIHALWNPLTQAPCSIYCGVRYCGASTRVIVSPFGSAVKGGSGLPIYDRSLYRPGSIGMTTA